MTESMEKALTLLNTHGYLGGIVGQSGSYGVRLATLKALERRGLVSIDYLFRAGETYYDSFSRGYRRSRSCSEYSVRLTDAGTSYLAAASSSR